MGIACTVGVRPIRALAVRGTLSCVLACLGAPSSAASPPSVLDTLVPDWKAGVIAQPPGPQPPGAQGPARDPAPGPAGAAPAVTGLEAAIDDGFLRWSRNWVMDRYVPGSVVVGNKECDASACKVLGKFRFVRMGNVLTIDFLALLGRSGDTQYSVAQLCYSDASTGMRDCR